MAFYALYDKNGGEFTSSAVLDGTFDRLCRFETRAAYDAVMNDDNFAGFWWPISRADARHRFSRAFGRSTAEKQVDDNDMLDDVLESDDGIDQWVIDESGTMGFWTGFPNN